MTQLDITDLELLRQLNKRGGHVGHTGPAMELARVLNRFVAPEECRGLLNSLAERGYLSKEVDGAARLPIWRLTDAGKRAIVGFPVEQRG